MKKGKMKIGVSVALMLVMVAVLFAGCSPDEAQSQAPAEQQEESAPVDDAAGSEAAPSAEKLTFSDVAGEGMGADYGFGPTGYDLDKVIEHYGKDKVKDLKIGVSVAHLANNWQIMWADEFKRLADVYGFELVLLSADEDRVKEVDNLKSLANQDLDGLIIYPQGVDSLPQTINEISANLPVVNAIPIPGSNVDATINVAQTDKGRMIADHVAEDSNGEELNVMMLDLSDDMAILRDRVNGFVEQSEKYPNIHVVEDKRGGTVDEWMNVTKETLLANESVNCIVATYTNPMMGAYNAVQQLGLEGQVKIYGVDADEATLALLRDGKINGLHVQWPQAQAYTCLFALLCALDGVEDIPEEILEPTDYAMFYADQSSADLVMSVLYPDL